MPPDILTPEDKKKALELMNKLLTEWDDSLLPTGDEKALLALVIVANDYGADIHRVLVDNLSNPPNWALNWRFYHEQAANFCRELYANLGD